MKSTTTGLMENFLQTLDGETFIKAIQEFDNVTQRQCLLKALKELRKSGTVRLHGQERVKNVAKKIRAVLEGEVVQVTQS